MGTLRLSESDREKYGQPELIEFDLAGTGVRQRAALERETKRSYRWLLDQLSGVPELDEHQNPIPELDEETGEPKLVDGEPVVKLTTDPDAIAMFVWLVLWGKGVRVPWETFDIAEIGLRLNFSSDTGSDTGGEPGKDEEPAADSESSTTAP